MRNGISGQAARKWRRKVASFARVKSDSTKTLKFPLESEKAIDFTEVTNLYEVTNGTKPGSLFHLLCAVHLTGFRLFPNVEQTRQFRNRQNLPLVQFQEAWQTAFNVEVGKLSPATLITYLAKKPRKVGNRAPTFENKPVAIELYRLARGTLPERDKEPHDEMLAFLNQYEKLLADEFGNRQSISDDIALALRLFDALCNSSSYDFPSMEQCFSSLIDVTPPNSRMAFDRRLMAADSSQNLDTLMHAVVAQKLAMLRVEGQEEDSFARYSTALKNEITTQTTNALDWVFGPGIDYFKKEEPEQVLTDFDIPVAAEGRVKQLHDLFIGFPKNDLFGKVNYKEFRQSVGGKVDSWISNYLKRLDEINVALTSMDEAWNLPNALSSDDVRALFSGLGLTFDEVQQAVATLLSHKADGLEMVQILSGQADRLPKESDVQSLEILGDEISGVTGLLRVLQNRLNQEAENDQSTFSAIAKNNPIELPDWCKRLPRINRISGGVPDVEGELIEAVVQLKKARSDVGKVASTLMDWAKKEDVLGNPLAHQSIFEQERSRAAGVVLNEQEAVNQARRNFFERLMNLAASGSDSFRGEVKCLCAPLTAKSSDLNRRIDNDLGAYYYSPFSRRRHEPYEVSKAFFSMNLERTLSELESRVKALLAENPDVRLLRDSLRLENLVRVFRLSALPDKIPGSLLSFVPADPDLRLPPTLRVLLKQPFIGRAQALKVLTLYNSEIMGKVAVLFRDSFILRTKFARIGFNALYYIPKDRNWQPPQQVLGSQSMIGKALASDFIAWDEDRHQVSPRETLNVLSTAKMLPKDRGTCPISCLLTQMPHDWYVDLAFQDSDASRLQVTGMKVSKSGFQSRLANLSTPFRLKGPSSFKTQIDHWLLNPKVDIGEHNLIIEKSYRQKSVLKPDGSIDCQVEPGEVNAFLAVAMNEGAQDPVGQFPLSETVIGIDLGEVGIGFAVFDASELNSRPAEKVTAFASGSIPIRSVRNLIKRVARYRGKTQPRQKFQQRFDTSLQLLRENATGDIAHTIDSLCWKYKGFPVLESSVRNLATGAQQLKLVYGKVLNLYIYSKIDSHKSDRKNHWMGAEKWEHPYLQQGKWSESKGKRSESDGEPLRLFPGTSVHPAYTSQTCSVCMRNPYQAIESAGTENGFKVGRGGIVNLDGNGAVLLMQKSDPAKDTQEIKREARQYRHEKLNTPFLYPVPEQTLNRKQLLSLVRRQLRQPQDSSRSKDTTQSVYQCLFADCGNRMHADENAAINIVRKWAQRLVTGISLTAGIRH